jgi:hypothetical protein
MSRAGIVAAVAGLVAASALAFPDGVLAQGCAMCKTTLDGSTDPLVGAMNVSVLFMMAMPYLIVGSIGSWIYFASRRGGPESAPPESREPTESK